MHIAFGLKKAINKGISSYIHLHHFPFIYNIII